VLRGAPVAHMTVCKFAFMKSILSKLEAMLPRNLHLNPYSRSYACAQPAIVIVACATKLTRNILRLQSQTPSSHSSLLPSAVEEHGSHALGHTL
jgi:hypothetical protein